MLAFRIFEDAGFHKKLRAVPEDDEGIDMDYLRSEIKKSEDNAIADNNNEPVRVFSFPCLVVWSICKLSLSHRTSWPMLISSPWHLTS